MYILTATEATIETQNSLKKKKKEEERLMRTLKGFGRTKYKVFGKGSVVLTCWGPGKGTERVAPRILEAKFCREAAYHLLIPPAPNSLLPSFSLHECGCKGKLGQAECHRKPSLLFGLVLEQAQGLLAKETKRKRKVIFHKLR